MPLSLQCQKPKKVVYMVLRMPFDTVYMAFTRLAQTCTVAVLAVTVTSLQAAQTWSVSSQSHLHPSTYFPGLMSAGIFSTSTISRFTGFPEQRQKANASPESVVALHASDSSHTGS
mmetsp:Transcript_137479/g.242972  ORF Transcript_137479/g.242972 Transcript_137479/m.242972 type:complete len:116 (+) Transcript_137479:106-453(+)